MTTNNLVYLVSGANRGIGFGIIQALVLQPNTIVFAGVRDVAKAVELNELATRYPTTLFVTQLRSGDQEDAALVKDNIKEKAGSLDVVIANAGICNYFGPLASTPVQEFEDHFKVNTLGPFVLFQGTAPLLLAAPVPKFVLISTGASSMGTHLAIPASAYGTSKAAANYLVCKMHQEHEADGLVATALAPGFVQTEIGAAGAKALGMADGAPMTVEDSVKAILKHVDGATREETGGKFWDWEGRRKLW